MSNSIPPTIYKIVKYSVTMRLVGSQTRENSDKRIKDVLKIPLDP